MDETLYPKACICWNEDDVGPFDRILALIAQDSVRRYPNVAGTMYRVKDRDKRKLTLICHKQTMRGNKEGADSTCSFKLTARINESDHSEARINQCVLHHTCFRNEDSPRIW